MALTKIGNRYLNLDLVIGVETGVRTAHPARPHGSRDQYVDDAIRVHFQGGRDPWIWSTTTRRPS